MTFWQLKGARSQPDGAAPQGAGALRGQCQHSWLLHCSHPIQSRCAPAIPSWCTWAREAGFYDQLPDTHPCQVLHGLGARRWSGPLSLSFSCWCCHHSGHGEVAAECAGHPVSHVLSPDVAFPFCMRQHMAIPSGRKAISVLDCHPLIPAGLVAGGGEHCVGLPPAYAWGEPRAIVSRTVEEG